MNIYAIGASFFGTSVELVEALTIILAVGSARSWKSSLLGAASAVVVLGVLIGVIGAPLTNIIRVFWVQVVVGLLMLLFGIRWLRKAILRYAGLKALHNEAEAYEEELERAKTAGTVATGIDHFAFTTTFSGTFLEGLEAVFIVITFGLSAHAMQSSIIGAAIATVVVLLLGVVLRAPLAKVPENTLKFVVGVMLTSFGAFWIGEGFGVAWPQNDVSILYLALTLCAFTWIVVVRCKRKLQHHAVSHATTTGVTR